MTDQAESFETATPVAAAPAKPTSGLARTLPHSLDAEEALLACVLIDGAGVLARCFSAHITPASFYDAKHGIVFECCMNLLAAGRPVDIVTVAEELRTARKLDQVGGYAFLTQVSGRIPTTAQASYFVEKVAEQAQLRDVIRLATGLVEECFGYTGDGVAAHLSATTAKLLSALSGEHTGRDRKWPAVVAEVEERALVLITKKVEPAGATISFGWPILDRVFKPMRRKEVVVVAARPSVGKSSLMRPIVAKAAFEGCNALVESLEVPPDDIAIQMAASMSRVNWGQLPSAHDAEQKDFLDALRSLSVPNLHVFDCDRTLAAITARAKAIHSTKPLDVVAIDYLGLVADCDPSRGETKAQAVGRVMKALKRLAGELNCVVLILAQLNRQSVTQGNREPILSDLRDSGDIEQDADRVIFIHRPDEDRITRAEQSDTDSLADRPRFFQLLIQAKGRNVGTGLVEFYFDRATTRFTPAADEPAQPPQPQPEHPRTQPKEDSEMF